jgi:hypothetical protein
MLLRTGHRQAMAEMADGSQQSAVSSQSSNGQWPMANGSRDAGTADRGGLPPPPGEGPGGWVEPVFLRWLGAGGWGKGVQLFKSQTWWWWWWGGGGSIN